MFDSEKTHHPGHRTETQKEFNQCVHQQVHDNDEGNDLWDDRPGPVSFEMLRKLLIPLLPEVFLKERRNFRFLQESNHKQKDNDPRSFYRAFHPDRGSRFVPHLHEAKCGGD